MQKMDTKQYLKKIGQNIKEKRVKKNLTQRELADQVGYKQQLSISKIETGDVSTLSIVNIKKIADILKTTPSRLIKVS